MTYDHYMCLKALLCSPVMPMELSAFLAASYLGGFINAFIVTKGPSALKFCSNNVIDDFFLLYPTSCEVACMEEKNTYQAVLFCVLASKSSPYCTLSWSPSSSPPALSWRSITQGHHKAFSPAPGISLITLFCGSRSLRLLSSTILAIHLDRRK